MVCAKRTCRNELKKFRTPVCPDPHNYCVCTEHLGASFIHLGASFTPLRALSNLRQHACDVSNTTPLPPSQRIWVVSRVRNTNCVAPDFFRISTIGPICLLPINRAVIAHSSLCQTQQPEVKLPHTRRRGGILAAGNRTGPFPS